MEWGKFRDAFDELAEEMEVNHDRFDKNIETLNAQLDTVNSQRTKYMMILAETISSINADTEEMNEKDEEKRDLQEEYDHTMKKFSDACTEILFTRICEVRKVRNAILVDSTTSPPSQISDCDSPIGTLRTESALASRGTPSSAMTRAPKMIRTSAEVWKQWRGTSLLLRTSTE
jgi:hypothetical protein